VVDLERRLALDVKVSVVLQLVEFAHDNLFRPVLRQFRISSAGRRAVGSSPPD
jgi:hypothetical protein